MSSCLARRCADPAALDRYLASLRAAGPLGDGTWDDDGFDGKVAALLADPPAVVSFTFGCPSAEVIRALQDAGSQVMITVTSPDEAALAAAAGADALCVQGYEAGAHRGTFANDDEPGRDYGLLSLIGEVARVTGLPQIAAGGIMGRRQLQAVIAAGAVAAQCGTAFLRCPESGAHPRYKAALADPRYTATTITRAFSGRPARGLVNQFIRDHPGAPAAYPEINNATRPLRAAAAAHGDPEQMSLSGRPGLAVRGRAAGRRDHRPTERHQLAHCSTRDWRQTAFIPFCGFRQHAERVSFRVDGPLYLLLRGRCHIDPHRDQPPR